MLFFFSACLMPNATKCIYAVAALLWALLAASCYPFDAEDALGNGYYFVDDGKTSTVLLASHIPPHGSGIPVLPYPVVAYGFNDDYIAAISTEQRTKRRNFWLIDKRRKSPFLNNLDSPRTQSLDSASWDTALHSNVMGPLDSVTYTACITEHHISLKLIKNKWYTP
jgi:hypothetical protein